MSLSNLSVRRPVAASMFFLAIVLLGFIALRQLAVDLFPDLNYPRLLIRTRYGDASPLEVQELITRPVEEAVSAVSGIKRITSRSREGISLVTLQFYWGTRMDYTALSVREKLDEIRFLLPREAGRPQVLRLDPSARPIMEIAVSGAAIGRLTDLCRQVIRRRLEQLPGVALVEVTGGMEPQIEVKVDPQKLLVQNISLRNIADALKQNNLSFSGGTIKKGRYRYALRIEGEFQSIDDVKQTAIIPASGAPPVRLGEIAIVRYIPRDRESLTRLNNRETVGLLVTKEAGANTVQVSRLIKKILKEIRNGYPELSFFIVSQQADFIESSISNVFFSLILGSILAFLSLFLFLHNFRHPVNIGLSMPVSILATFVFMRLAKVNINMMSLGGLALGIGMLVDNSIIVLENIFRLREEGKDEVTASIVGAREVAMPIVASTLTTCAVFLPIIYVRGIAGQLFRDQSLTVTFSLLASLLAALSLLPVLTSRFRGRRSLQPSMDFTAEAFTAGKKPSVSYRIAKAFIGAFYILWGKIRRAFQNFYRKTTSPLFRRFDLGLNSVFNAYHRLLLYALDHKSIVLAILCLSFVLTFFVGYSLDRRFLPPLHPDEIRYHLRLPPDASLYQTGEVTEAIVKRLLADPHVAYIFSRVGKSQSILQATRPAGLNEAELIIRKKPGKTVNTAKFVAGLRERLPKTYTYQGYFEGGEKIYTDVLGLQGKDLELDIQGDFIRTLLPVAREMKQRLSRLRGIADTQISYRAGVTQYRIQIDRNKAAFYGITVNDVGNAIRNRFHGRIATRLKEFDRTIDILLRPDIKWRNNWKTVSSQLFNFRGRPLPLKEIIHSRQVQTPEELTRQNQQAVIRLTASLAGLPRKTAIREIQQIADQMQLPETVHIRFGGRQRELRDSFNSLKMALLLSVILVYMIMAAQFESLRYALLILATIPFGVIGGIWLLAVAGQSLNVISGVGFIVLTGIVVNDAIIKVDFINQSRRAGKPVRAAILEASQKRFRPILITTVTTVFGLVPMALSSGNGAALRQPLAIVLIGGLSLATLLTLVIIPMLYELISGKTIK